jgi:hypothetical protein
VTPKPTKPLNYDQAISLMRRVGVRLLRTNEPSGGFFVVGSGCGGRVDDQVATKIQSHPLVRAGKDGLWPGHDQTWRMIVDPRPGGAS